jgi:flagellar motor switch protein FliN/FliY
MSSADDPLLRLGQSTGEAISGVLEMFAPGQVSAGSVDIVSAEHHPLEGIPTPAVLTSVSYIDGVTGGNLFAMSVTGARKLAAAMMGMEPEESDEELSELELSAVAEAMNQMMASAAMATTEVLGTEVEIGVPETKTFSSASDAIAAYERTPHTVRTVVTICGEQCRLVQLVPNAFVVRMTRALDEMGAEYADQGSSAAASAGAGTGQPEPAGLSLSGIPVRVWAELGRAQMPSAQIVALPTGAVVELDRQADEPIDLYVNGMRFASGRLIVVDGSDWAVRIDTIFDMPEAATPPTQTETETSPLTNDMDIPNPQEVA